ncbi:MAG: exosortase/archaeosortase family protein [Chlorobium sp.]|nr:MAG: exosortase/archaeosortase family protein [Chlorobium sp.]
MNLKPQPSWFPWLLFAAVMLHSGVKYTLVPSIEPDLLLLYPTLLAVLWMERNSILETFHSTSLGHPVLGFVLFIVGSFFSVAGGVAPSLVAEVLGLFFIAAGFVASFAPSNYLRSALFIAFAGIVIVILGSIGPSLLSSELAVTLAALSAKVLSATILPVVANGVTLYFGQYSATVTKDCSGMNSIFSLTALSILYLREGVNRKPWHIALMVVSIFPVAVITNFMRVMLVVLATWYVGDWFAQSIFHETIGVVAFVLALLLLTLIDKLLLFASSIVKPKKGSSHAAD